MPLGRHPSGLYAVPDGFQKVVSKRSPTGVTLERNRERERERERERNKEKMNIKSGWEGEGMDGLLFMDIKLWSACTLSVISQGKEDREDRSLMSTGDRKCSLLGHVVRTE
jgi:hypothetical protein